MAQIKTPRAAYVFSLIGSIIILISAIVEFIFTSIFSLIPFIGLLGIPFVVLSIIGQASRDNDDCSYDNPDDNDDNDDYIALLLPLPACRQQLHHDGGDPDIHHVNVVHPVPWLICACLRGQRVYH